MSFRMVSGYVSWIARAKRSAIKVLPDSFASDPDRLACARHGAGRRPVKSGP